MERQRQGNQPMDSGSGMGSDLKPLRISQISETGGGSSAGHSRLSKKPITAIFIHAGAGFHSVANERLHLEACSKAASMGMKFLKNGASAAEAVVAAIKVLEDLEITNAGYGSNVNMDGLVECDATVVDHKGRSGACGAVPNIRNPICLAKLILDQSMSRLSLGRLPPNLLVGDGATYFASRHGMTPVPNDFMISRNARDRFMKWRTDMLRAEQEADSAEQKKTGYEPSPCECKSRVGCPHQPDHANAIATGTWNEGQPDSPSENTLDATPAALGEIIQPDSSPKPSSGKSKNSLLSALTNAGNSRSSKKRRLGTCSPECRTDSCPQHKTRDRSSSPQPESAEGRNMSVTKSPGFRGGKRPRQVVKTGDGQEDDLITDTVGCIAIDQDGHIGAGSSSGGIGMKHRGRIGPAALVGIGTAVVPESPNDDYGTTTASIMSGTGEHFATTMAAQRAAERIYYGTRQGPHGEDVHDDDDDAIMKSFILKDFLRHPGVAGMNSGLAAAIGTITAKKCKDGIYFMFAHNTDSFALASMFSTDKEPRCLMSRLNKTSKVYDGCATGGRGIGIKP